MRTKILLEEADLPTHWYNIIADMPNPPAPQLGPDGKPVGPEALQAIFPDTAISTWPPTTAISRVSWKTSTSHWTP